MFVLCNYDTTIEQDIERINLLRSLNYKPYVMLYRKSELPKGSVYKRLEGWCNNKRIFAMCKDFKDYRP